ncbi:MAG TPA: hypothetical protein VGM81_06245 [Burkholderiaceae bacterium]|jgi:hypothetical protein
MNHSIFRRFAIPFLLCWISFVGSALAAPGASVSGIAATTPQAKPPSTVITLTTCDFDTVQTAVNDAALSDTTIKLPALVCDWGLNELFVWPNIHLQGAGADKTQIIRTAYAEGKFLIKFDCLNEGYRKPELSDMKLTGLGDGRFEDYGVGLINGCMDFKIYNSTFEKFTFAAIKIADAPSISRQRGAIFNNRFLNNYNPLPGYPGQGRGYGVIVYGGGTWPDVHSGEPVKAGPNSPDVNPDGIYVEDNYFYGSRHNIASNDGSVYIFRYNTMTGLANAQDYWMVDAHGLTPTVTHSSRAYEIYKNNFITDVGNTSQRSAITLRGGEGLVFSNTVPDTVNRVVELYYEDKNEKADADGYVCTQAAEPYHDKINSLYIWNNSTNPNTPLTIDGIYNNCPLNAAGKPVIALNTDYFKYPKVSYLPYRYPHKLAKTDREPITLNSCEFIDVNAAVSANSDKTIILPANTCNWGDNQLSVPAGIELRGAGIDKTIITSKHTISSTKPLISYDCSNGKQAVLSNMTLEGTGNESVLGSGLALTKGCVDFQVFNTKFTKFTYIGIQISDVSRSATDTERAKGQHGVIYGSQFIDNNSANLIEGSGNWQELDLGSKYAVFVEDNQFSGNQANIDSRGGSAYVFRHNTITRTSATANSSVAYVGRGVGTPNGSRSYEIYGNTYDTNHNATMSWTPAISISSGDGVVFNNILPGFFRGIGMYCAGVGSEQAKDLYIWGLPPGTDSNGYIYKDTCPSFAQPKTTKRPGYTPYIYPHPLRPQDYSTVLQQQ